MKKELEESLVQKYPEMLKEYYLSPFESCLGRGFECDDGWYELVDKCCSQLKQYEKKQNIKIIVTQIKEKLARLTIYIRVSSGKKEHINDAWNIANNFAEKSRYVCESCGKKFDEIITKNIDGWLSTKCENCRKEGSNE